MLSGRPVLIVEDEAIIALGLAAAVRDAGGKVIGPSATVQNAFDLLRQNEIAAAILDANLADRDVAPLAMELASQGVPFVIHTGTGLPAELADWLADIPVVMKPADAAVVVSTIQHLIEQSSELKPADLT